jgi:hypothetical protein
MGLINKNNTPSLIGLVDPPGNTFIFVVGGGNVCQGIYSSVGLWAQRITKSDGGFRKASPLFLSPDTHLGSQDSLKEANIPDKYLEYLLRNLMETLKYAVRIMVLLDRTRRAHATGKPNTTSLLQVLATRCNQKKNDDRKSVRYRTCSHCIAHICAP